MGLWGRDHALGWAGLSCSLGMLRNIGNFNVTIGRDLRPLATTFILTINKCCSETLWALPIKYSGSPLPTTSIFWSQHMFFSLFVLTRGTSAEMTVGMSSAEGAHRSKPATVSWCKSLKVTHRHNEYWRTLREGRSNVLIGRGREMILGEDWGKAPIYFNAGRKRAFGVNTAPLLTTIQFFLGRNSSSCHCVKCVSLPVGCAYKKGFATISNHPSLTVSLLPEMSFIS